MLHCNIGNETLLPKILFGAQIRKIAKAKQRKAFSPIPSSSGKIAAAAPV
jgi:hypothetical protein